MEVELDLSEPCVSELRELIEEVRPVLLAGEEPAVARRASLGVAELAECGIAVRPRIDTRDPDRIGSAAPQGLVVIAEGEQDVTGSARLWRPRTSDQVPAVVPEPVMQVLFAKTA